MSEEQEIQEHFDIDPEALAAQEAEEAALAAEAEEEETEGEPKELPKGFMSKEAWVEAGKDPEEWVSPDVFKERTQRIQSESRLKRQLQQEREEFDSRIKNLNLLQQAQLNRQREELVSRRDDLIDVADKEGVRKIDKELKDLDSHADLVADREEQKVAKPPEVVEWEEENPWCMDINDPRTPVAQKAFKEAVESGKTMAGALRAAEKAAVQVKATPDGKPKKAPIQMADRGQSAAINGKDSPSLSWSQLKPEEVTMYEEFFEGTGMTKKDYLKTVADERKGA